MNDFIIKTYLINLQKYEKRVLDFKVAPFINLSDGEHYHFTVKLKINDTFLYWNTNTTIDNISVDKILIQIKHLIKTYLDLIKCKRLSNFFLTYQLHSKYVFDNNKALNIDHDKTSKIISHYLNDYNDMPSVLNAIFSDSEEDWLTHSRS